MPNIRISDGLYLLNRHISNTTTKVILDKNSLYDFAFVIKNNKIFSYPIDGRIVNVPEGTEDVYWFAEMPPSANFELSKTIKLHPQSDEIFKSLYASLIPLTERMLYKESFCVLKLIGDVKFIHQFNNCLEKQSYIDFQNEISDAVFDNSKRYKLGYNQNEIITNDDFTLLDLLYLLQNNEGNLFYPNHPEFEYERTSHKTETVVSNEIENKLNNICLELSKTRNPDKIKILSEQLSALANETNIIKFIETDKNSGYPISQIVTNEDRANISALIQINGTIDLTHVLKEDLFIKKNNNYITTNGTRFPINFPTKIHKTYTIIRDGVRNIDKLPVSLTKKTRDELISNGVKIYNSGSNIELIDLTTIPLINHKMITSISAKELFEKTYELQKNKAKQKVINYYMKQYFPKDSFSLHEIYGYEVAEWLNELGIKDYGYNPKVKTVSATTSYMSKELSVSLSGISSLPSVDDVLKKIKAKKKLTFREKLLEVTISDLSSVFSSSSNLEAYKMRLFEYQKNIINNSRRLMKEIAQIKFSIIVGQTWFKEFNGNLNNNSLTINFDGQEIKCTANLVEKEIKI